MLGKAKALHDFTAIEKFYLDFIHFEGIKMLNI